MVKFSKLGLCFESLHGDTDRRCCVQMSSKFVRREIVRVIYPNKKTIKFRLLSLLRGSRPKKSASARHGRRNVSKSGTARVEKRAQQARESRRQRRLGVEVWGGVSPSQPTRGSGERRELP